MRLLRQRQVHLTNIPQQLRKDRDPAIVGWRHAGLQVDHPPLFQTKAANIVQDTIRVEIENDNLSINNLRRVIGECLDRRRDIIPSGIIPQAKAAADPPEEPPAFRSGLNGWFRSVVCMICARFC